MKFSERWLREWVSPALDAEALAAQLTMAGLEVEAIERAGAPVKGVVSAVVRAVERHPDAERLSVCRVFDGSAEFQVVCGAPNVRAGLCAVFAREGAVLPAITIRRATLRGVESWGMLCSADELGLESQSDGLLELPAGTEPGQDANTLLGLGDAVFSLKLTPNRGDCLGMRGLAREIAALNRLPVAGPALRPVPAVIPDALTVTLADPVACPRYAGRVVRGVDVRAPSPLWMQERLRRAGVRSIDAVVDISNYVMLELGQPMHAFDLGKLRGGITVRSAHDGESLALLDGTTQRLRADTLVIADEAGAVALAGIMGGQDSAVGETTRDVFLEAAFFAPQPLAGKARSYGMQTDASQRFERGVDFDLQPLAIERATQLLLEITGGTPGPVVRVSADARLPALEPIALRAARLDGMLGQRLAAADVQDILARLGLRVEPAEAGWRVTPPAWRFDLRIEADLIEEVARVHGYDRIPLRVQPAATAIRPAPEARRELGELRRRLVALGYQEAVTFSFVDPRMQDLLDPGREPVALANPMSAEMAVMRTTLWSGLLGALVHNRHRQQRRVRLFESGLRFLPGADGLAQRPAIAGVATGTRAPEGWANPRDALDFFDIKGDVEALLDETLAEAFTLEPARHPALHPGQSAVLRRDGVEVGWLGALHPAVAASLDLHEDVFLFELDLEGIGRKTLPSFKGLSKFPEVRRDIAVVVPESVTAETVLATARQAAGERLADLKLFDIYRGQGVDLEKKSMAIGIVLQDPERTLTDADVNAAVEQVFAALAMHCGAVARA
jgi:phenylalanyl-tRNA synthetase beta chain